ncbi:lipoprotein [Sphingomonas sp. Root720]|uniref:lipoprotein n=1 Tax=Sphingomonas sp. Root720 TaxID=1736595 RepID=UPI0009E7D1E0|nr:lipoprotein [Sphingomonas sp. Root720]
MRRLTIAAFAALALSGCTGAHIKKPAVCDGRHRRPANLYGSILPTLPVPLPASQGGGQSMVAPGPAPGPGALPAPPPAPPTAPGPAPDAGSTPTPPQTGGPTAPTSAPRTSKRDDELSYLSC